MRIFISHKDVDREMAVRIHNYLLTKGISSYLDVLDDNLESNSERLTKHLKSEMRQCSHLLTVLSEATKRSWWVPFEIGLASQKDSPIVNFLIEGIELPGYLDFWPRLRKIGDLDKYINALEKPKVELNKSYGMITESYSDQFHKYLKSIL